MKFSVSKGVLEKFPELNIGIVIAKKINNEGESEEVMKFIREKENEIRKNFNSETLSQNQRIEIWREVYSSFGAKPKKYKCSVENL
ncbi:MAG: hypothetical protein COW21_04880, partial [Candidatus Aenigmarchaeota archaeon CG15_BIG_FIL_POST_REV_8_21_14_020_37_27]